MLNDPLKYVNAILFREFIYKRNKSEKEVISKTFFGAPMHLLLPSGTDIYLTGGKSHDSEIRLTRFMINFLKPGDTVVDIGAHYGYYTLLAAHLTGPKGRVIAYEASPATYQTLIKNTAGLSQISTFNQAVADQCTELKFYEFPNLYSEYNSFDVSQFAHEPWFARNKPREITIPCTTLDQALSRESLPPALIKIDVEGAEDKVIRGMSYILNKTHPVIILEYLTTTRSNRAHQAAESLLNSCGFTAHIIKRDGNITKVSNIEAYLNGKGLDSDNIAFIKT